MKVLKRDVSGRYRVYSHQEFRLRDIDEKITFVGVIVMPREFHGLVAEHDRLRAFERHRWNQPIRIVHFLQKVADGIEGDNLQAWDALKGYGTADMIFWYVRINQHLDRLVRDFSDGFRNVFALSGRRLQKHNAGIGQKRG